MYVYKGARVCVRRRSFSCELALVYFYEGARVSIRIQAITYLYVDVVSLISYCLHERSEHFAAFLPISVSNLMFSLCSKDSWRSHELHTFVHLCACNNIFAATITDSWTFYVGLIVCVHVCLSLCLCDQFDSFRHHLHRFLDILPLVAPAAIAARATVIFA